MKMTLLEMTQNILSAMDAEEVTSISDTIESLQVAEEIKTTYYESLGNFEIPSQLKIISFTGLADADHPNMMKVDETVDQFSWVKYNTNTTADPSYKPVTYVTPEEFWDIVLNDNSGTQTTVYEYDTDLPYTIRSDKAPEYYTIFDDEYIVFDSYNSSIDTTLQAAKCMAYAQVLPSWTENDTFTPDLHAKYFPMLLAEAKSACFINYKGVANQKEERRSSRQRIRLQNNNSRNNAAKKNNDKYDFGRS